MIIQKTNTIEMLVENSSVSQSSRSMNVLLDAIYPHLPKDALESVVFKSTDGNIVLDSSDVLGNALKRESSATLIAGSIGYLATRYNGAQTETGFVTAGHSFPPVLYLNDPVYTASGQRIGTVTQAIGCPDYELSGTGNLDYAFVKLDSGITISPSIYDSNYQQNPDVAYVIPAENGVVFKSGSTTGLTAGVVVSLYFNTAEDFNTGPLVKRIICTYDSAGGDSGGIVYVVNNGKAEVVGIHQGRYEVIDSVNGVSTLRKVSIVVSAYNIHNEGIVAGY